MTAAYLTEGNLRLLVIGASGAAMAVALVALLRGRPRWIAGWLGPALGLFAIDWLRWPEPSPDVVRVAATLVVGVLAGAGYERLTRPPHVAALTLLASAGGVWLAIPENSPVAIVIGAVLGLALCGAVAAPGVGYGLGLALAWTVLLGARTHGYSFDGGLLCLAPLAARPVVDALGRRRGGGWLPAWPWLVIGTAGLSVASARWIGVAPDSTWPRVAVIGAGAAVLAVLVRR